RAVHELKIGYPVAVDSEYAIWRAFDNQYWPAHYFIDTEGRIRHHHFGEGDYAQSEHIIQQLLAETGRKDIAKGVVAVHAAGAEAAPDADNVKSPETYIGFARSESFSSPGGVVQDVDHPYALPADLRLNQWALDGTWKVEDERAVLGAPGG